MSGSILPALPADVLPDMDAKKDTPVAITWLDNGLAVVVADRPDIIEHVRETYGLNMFYLVADYQWKERWPSGKLPNGQTYAAGEMDHVQPRVFKVVYNAIGYSIHEAAETRTGMCDIEQEAQFTLPAIPYELVQKMEAFFREVHRLHRSEAIVVLTFDPTIDGADSPKGWGIAVPEQRNNAGHCDYNQESIVADLPDNAIIVGTAHSHPEMSAFASGTDHKDQADFDGIHITFGWQSHINGGLIQHYIEMQMGGKNWELDPKDIFSGMPVPEVDEEVTGWTKKVTKSGAPQQASYSWLSPKAAGGGGVDSHIQPHLLRPFERTQQFALLGEGLLAAHIKWAETHMAPQNCPNPVEYMVIAELTGDDETICPVCTSPLDSAQIANRRCTTCWNFLAKKMEDACAVAEQRIARRLDFFDIDPNRQTKKPIRIWRRWYDDQGEFHYQIDNVEAAAEGQLLPFAVRSEA